MNNKTSPRLTRAQLYADLKTERIRVDYWRALADNAAATIARQAAERKKLNQQVHALLETIETIKRGHLDHAIRLPAEYYINHTDHGVIVVRHGLPGFNKTIATPEHAAAINAAQGHTPAQVHAAEACSMFNNWQDFGRIAEMVDEADDDETAETVVGSGSHAQVTEAARAETPSNRAGCREISTFDMTGGLID